MGKVCFLCCFRPSKRPHDSTKTHRSLHCLPAKEATRFLWIKVCGLEGMVDENPHLRICSAHFKSDDYIDPKAKENGSRCLFLKPNAVPSVSVPHPMPVLISEPTTSATEVLVLPAASSELINSEVEPISSQELTPPLVTQVLNLQSQSESDNQEVTKTSSEYALVNAVTPKKRRFAEPRFVNEMTASDFATPRRARRSLSLAKSECNKKSREIKRLQDKNRYLRNKITSLIDLVKHLQKKGLMTEEAGDTLMEVLPANLQEVVTRKLKRKGRYSPQLRSFALTLHFYSPKAYNYVRKCWDKLLPHPSTIRQWYRVVDGAPGFTSEALHAISLRSVGSKPVICNLVLDEIAIREQIIYDMKRFHGGVDLGTTSDVINDNDNITHAKNALVFMAVSLNSHWKVPIGYFLIKSLNGTERANLLKRALELLSAAGANIYSITFDGISTNLTMCTALGANFDYYSPDFKPYFINHH